MNTQEYIQSGIIESFVLGMASGEESAELRDMCIKHTEIQKAVDEFAELMEKFAMSNAIAPPDDLKQRLFDELQDEFSADETNTAPAVVEMYTPQQTKAGGSLSFWKYMAAASVILFMASGITNLYLYNNYKSANGKYEALLIEKSTLQANNQLYQAKYDSLSASMALIQNPDMQVIQLAGVKGKENSHAIICWDKKTKDVYFIPTTMATLEKGKQYQLWAIVDGKPVDAGVIGNCDGMVCKAKNIPRAQMFAITIEKEGGSPAPSLDQMVVAGAI